jgi:DNA repair exonuclease SbcCD nuclease subunit
VPKLVHAADLHLDSPLTGLEEYQGAPVRELRRATRDALSRLVELCIAEQARLLLIAGDLFDGGWRDYQTGLYFVEQMTRLRDASVNVVWIRGNHDAASRLTRYLKPPDNVRELSHRAPETVILEAADVAVHGQGFSRADVRDDLSLRYPAPISGALNVGLLHTALDGREGHDRYAPCTVSGLLDRGYEYFALGHVHAHEVVHRAPWVVYPGNLQGRHARETGAKGAVVVTYEGARVTSVEHRALDVARWVRLKVDATSCRTLDDVGDAVRAAFQAAAAEAGQRLLAARVVISGASHAHGALHRDPETCQALVRSAALDASSGLVWVERVAVETALPGAERADALVSVGPLAELSRELAELSRDEEARARFVAEVPGLSEVLRKVRPSPAQEAFLEDFAVEPAALLREAEALIHARLGELEEP